MKMKKREAKHKRIKKENKIKVWITTLRIRLKLTKKQKGLIIIILYFIKIKINIIWLIQFKEYLKKVKKAANHRNNSDKIKEQIYSNKPKTKQKKFKKMRIIKRIKILK